MIITTVLVCFSTFAHADGPIDTSSPSDTLASSSHVTRRLAQIHLSPGDNLQTAVDNANAGDELILADGTYTGTGTAHWGDNMVQITKDITIRALNPGMAILDGENARRPIAVRGSTSVVLDGLSITGGSASTWTHNGQSGRNSGGGVVIAINGGDTVTLNNCNIYSNDADGGGGIRINTAGDGVIMNSCKIYDNNANGGNGGGVSVNDGTRLTSTCEVHAGASVLGGRRMEAAASPELDFVPRAEHEALKEKVAKLERALASVLRGDQA